MWRVQAAAPNPTESPVADDLDQAILIITAVMVPIGLLPFLLARIEAWVAAPHRLPSAKFNHITPGEPDAR